jgi:hypothetical protein
MTRAVTVAFVAAPIAAVMTAAIVAAREPSRQPRFHTADRCVACHNGLFTPAGEDVSIGFDWRASLMANSSRDPYWQASVRREIADHPASRAAIEDECSICHMPIPRYEARLGGRSGRIFEHLPFHTDEKQGRAAADGVSCSVCHQISAAQLGTPESFNGGFVVDPPDAADNRPEYGPFQVDAGHVRVMRSSSEGFRPTATDHIRRSEMCATCHTLMTTALGPNGEAIGSLPEQMPYQEWLHSDYKETRSCQSCHMPAIDQPVPITRVFGPPREGASRHLFVGGNFFMQRMLNRFRDDLEVAALPQELTAAADRTVAYLGSEAARLSVQPAGVRGGRLDMDVAVENLGGHKLPTAYPSRRAWLHVTVRDRDRRIVFESGAVARDGSISGDDNDADPSRCEPHYTEIRSGDEVQIYESILGDANGAVTTGLLTAVRYLKDNRLLPHGFDKRTAEPRIAVLGDAAADPDFAGGGDRVHYSIAVAAADGPFTVDAELLYQPIGFRWANNLKRYDGSPEPRRFAGYYDAMSESAATTLARASASVR